MLLLPTIADRPAAPRRALARSAVTRRPGFGVMCWAWTFLLSLVLLAQTLGQMHTVLHTAALQGETHAHTALDGLDHSHVHPSGQWLTRLLSGHGSASDCRLYDQVSHADCVPTSAVLPALARHAPVMASAFPASAQTRSTLRVQARGPPPWA